MFIEEKNRDKREEKLQEDMKIASENANKVCFSSLCYFFLLSLGHKNLYYQKTRQRIALQAKIREMHAKKAEARKKAKGENQEEEPTYSVHDDENDESEDIKIDENEDL